MAHGFRQPLAALARRGAGRNVSGGSKAACRRFCIMSAFAWGGSVLLTAITIASHQLSDSLQSRGIVTPSLFETRTCFYDNLTPKHYTYEHTFLLDLGSVCYYYGPLAALVAANGVCVALTIRRVRGLRRDTSILRRDAPDGDTGCAPPQFTEWLRSGLLYAKLLLTAGILELALEAAAWGASPKPGSKFHYNMWLSVWTNAMTFNVVAVFLDLARAAAVLWMCAGSRNRARQRLAGACWRLQRRVGGCAGGALRRVGGWCVAPRGETPSVHFSSGGRRPSPDHHNDLEHIRP